MKRPEIFLLPLDGMLVHCRITPSNKFSSQHLYTGWKAIRESYPKTRHNVPDQDLNPNHLIRRWAHKKWGHGKLLHVSERSGSLMILLNDSYNHWCPGPAVWVSAVQWWVTKLTWTFTMPLSAQMLMDTRKLVTYMYDLWLTCKDWHRMQAWK